MYKSEKTYLSLKIYKEDLLELENLLLQKFSEGIDRKNISLRTPNRNLSHETMQEILNHSQTVTKIDTLNISISKFAEDYSTIKSIRIYITKSSFSVVIEALDEIWVNGMAQFIKDFIKKRKSIVSKLSNYIPFLAGGLIGGNVTILAYAAKNNDINFIIVGAILLILGLFLSNPFLIRKIIPIVRLSLNSKKKMDILGISTVVGTIFGILSFIVSVIALWM
ncbi:hypothetical protein CN689_00980 [Peribacillus butanolivorans]|uniref:Uncharacterized protein n=1 Tax=Peribacillus butanolivorans TaxID=421767 RepID=A0AAX0S6X0_9BACI|nr:hypothetical protein [Peribacillus butanolivorans]PEJ37506.1 hypothetical protein CN689_00980 [Peribacillus butanolivorans]